MSNSEVDVLVIGSGISGLYLANKILDSKRCKVVVLEKFNRPGGRAHDTTFRGVNIHEGAGVGRVGHDNRLAALAGLKASHKKAKEPKEVMKFISELRATRQKPNELFGEFARRVLKGRYTDFENAVGYSDFQQASVPDTLDYYGFEHLECDTFAVPWNGIVKNMIENIKRKGGVLLNYGVKKIAGGTVLTEHGSIKAKVIVLAVPPHVAAKLLKLPLASDFGENKFVRGYSELDLGTQANVKALKNVYPEGIMTHVPCNLQKVMPMKYTGTKVVMMSAYADSQRANALVPLSISGQVPLNNKASSAKIVAELRKLLDYLPDPFRVVSSKAIVAFPGTHCFKPLSPTFRNRDEFLHAARRPAPKIFMVGEAMSKMQGWTEGALESVEAIMSDLLHLL